MSNQIVTKTNEMSLAGAETLRDSIREDLKVLSKGYLSVVPNVAKLYDCKGYKALGYKNIDDMCREEFGMAHGTVVGIRQVFKKFGVVSKDNKYLIPEKYLDFGYTKLLLFTGKDWERAGIDPIEEFTPDMTIPEMKSALKLKLEDKADKQDKEAIDTPATDVTENAEDVSMIDNSEASDNAEEANSPKDLIKSMLADLKALHEMIGEVKPEKELLFEGVEYNIKEIRKLIK